MAAADGSSSGTAHDSSDTAPDPTRATTADTTAADTADTSGSATSTDGTESETFIDKSSTSGDAESTSAGVTDSSTGATTAGSTGSAGSTDAGPTTTSTTGGSSSTSTGEGESSDSDTTSTGTGERGESGSTSVGDEDGGYCGMLTSASAGESDGGSGGSDTGPKGPCGDGDLDAGEDCDDGNQIGGDGCEADCTSSDGVNPEWTLELGGPDGYVDCGTGVAFDCAGNLIVAAYTEPDVIWIRKYDTSYVEQWTVTYPGIPGSGPCPRVRVATDADGNVGFIGEVGLDVDIFFGLLNADGAELWTETVTGTLGIAGTDYAGDVSFDIDGTLLLTGGLGQASTSVDVWAAKYDSLGGQIWSDLYDLAAYADSGYGVDVDAEGNVLLSGSAHNGIDLDIFVRKYDPDGTPLWTDIIAGAAGTSDFGFGVATVGLDVIAAGILRDVPMDGDAWVRRYDPSGGEVWTSMYTGTGVGDDTAYDSVAANDGTILVAGYVRDAAQPMRWVARVRGDDGSVVWERRIPSGGAWRAVASAPDGRVVVAGWYGLPFPWDAEAVFAVYPP